MADKVESGRLEGFAHLGASRARSYFPYGELTWEVDLGWGVWELNSFTVPASVPHKRIANDYVVWRNKFGDAWEKRGYEVKCIVGPWFDRGIVSRMTCLPDERIYMLAVRVMKRPEVVTWSIPDQFVPMLEAKGFKLVD